MHRFIRNLSTTHASNKKGHLTKVDQPRDYLGNNKVFENQLVWTIDDVATELNCSVRHVRKLVSIDRIPYVKVGRLVRFVPARICEWLEKGGTR